MMFVVMLSELSACKQLQGLGTYCDNTNTQNIERVCDRLFFPSSSFSSKLLEVWRIMPLYIVSSQPPPLQDLCLGSSAPCLAQHHVGPLWWPTPFQFGGVRCLGPGGRQQQCVETWVCPSPFLWRCSELLGVPQGLHALTTSNVTGLKRQLLVTQPTPTAPLTHLYLYSLCMYTHGCSQPPLTQH